MRDIVKYDTEKKMLIAIIVLTLIQTFIIVIM